jgi:hypothetical protein
VGGIDAGRVHVYFGSAAPDETPDLTLEGFEAGAGFGNCVDATGDYDGDGVADLVVGAYTSGKGGYQTGAVYGFRGGATIATSPDLTLIGQNEGGRFGTNVAVCDIDGDASDDIIVAEFRGPGTVYVFLGGKDRDDVPDLALAGRADGDSFGISLSATRDLGDGKPALLVGAHGNDFAFSEAGQAYLYTFAPR